MIALAILVISSGLFIGLFLSGCFDLKGENEQLNEDFKNDVKSKNKDNS